MLVIKRKLAQTLRIMSPQKSFTAVEHMVKIYAKYPHLKGESWSSPRTVMYIDETVSGARGYSVKAAFKDIRLALDDDCFAQHNRQSNDSIDRLLGIELGPQLKNTSSPTEMIPNNDDYITNTINTSNDGPSTKVADICFESTHSSDETILDMKREVCDVDDADSAVASPSQPAAADKTKLNFDDADTAAHLPAQPAATDNFQYHFEAINW